jgi:MFS family permease
VRQDRVLPTLITIVALVNLLFGGPLVVGSAALSKVRFVEGSAAYGAMLSAFAVGMLIGTLVAGAVRTQHSGQITLYLLAMQGLLMAAIGFAPTLIAACGLWLLIGCGSGFGNVHVITITQKHITKEMIGRVMSVIVLAEVGLGPISNALAGVLADLNLTVLFVLAGGLLTLTAVLAATNPDVRAAES